MRLASAGLAAALLVFAASACATGDDDDSSAQDIDADDSAGADDAGDDTLPDDTAADDADDDDSVGPVPPQLDRPCTDTPDAVYATPPDLPPFDAFERGRVLRCAQLGRLDEADINNLLELGGVEGLAASGGASDYVLSYRTEREDGVPGIGTARITVPDTAALTPVPLVVSAHGTAGLADDCAPSLHALTSELVVAWVAFGYPVVAPDYAGLGNEGTQGYGFTPDTAHSVIDAARAMKAALAEGSTTDEVIVVGLSQGGGAALGAQAFGSPYGAPDLEVTAVVAFAAGYPGGHELDGWRFPNLPLTAGEGVTRAVGALGLYGSFANLYGEDRACEGYNPAIRDVTCEAVETQCIFSLTDTLDETTPDYTPPDTLGELIDPVFREGVVDCVDGIGCSADELAYIARSEANDVSLDPGGGRVLMISGSDDINQPPASQACLRDQLIEDGVTPENCVIEGVDHYHVVPAGMVYAMTWATGGAAECPSDLELPDCPY